MATQAAHPIFSKIPSSLGSLCQPNSVSMENILSAAEDGCLPMYLAEHYTNYYDKNWQAHLQLCRDLVEAGYLKAKFDEHFDGTPIFISENARITIAGREYLKNLRNNRPLRRFLIWTAIYLSGILSAWIVRTLSQ